MPASLLGHTKTGLAQTFQCN